MAKCNNFAVELKLPRLRGLVQQCIKIITEIVVNMNVIARIKFRSKLKNFTSAIGYYSYTNVGGNRKKPKNK